MAKITYIVQKSDVGKTTTNLRVQGVLVDFENTLGRVQAGDVGKKMVYNVMFRTWQVENDQQYRARIVQSKIKSGHGKRK